MPVFTSKSIMAFARSPHIQQDVTSASSHRVVIRSEVVERLCRRSQHCSWYDAMYSHALALRINMHAMLCKVKLVTYHKPVSVRMQAARVTQPVSLILFGT